MTPEAKARQQIDHKLEQAGWVLQDMKQFDLSAGFGIAVREFPTDTGPARAAMDAVSCRTTSGRATAPWPMPMAA